MFLCTYVYCTYVLVYKYVSFSVVYIGMLSLATRDEGHIENYFTMDNNMTCSELIRGLFIKKN